MTALPARDVGYQVVQSMRATIAYNTPNIGTSGVVPLGTLPDGAMIVDMLVKVTTVFNAATTNVLTIGSTANASLILGDTDVDELEADITEPFVAKGYIASGDLPLYVKYAQTGTAATTGAATIVLMFIANTDR